MSSASPISDNKVLLERLARGRPLDAETYRRVRERQEAITAGLRKNHGQMDIALDLLANGLSAEQITEELPDLEPADIQACLRFTSRRVADPEPVA